MRRSPPVPNLTVTLLLVLGSAAGAVLVGTSVLMSRTTRAFDTTATRGRPAPAG